MSAPGSRPTRFRPLRWRWRAALVSLLIVAAGLAAAWGRGVPVGIDFSGGTLLVVEFDRDGVHEPDVRRALAALPGEPIVQRYGRMEDRRMLVRVAPDPGRAGDLDDEAGRVADALRASSLPPFAIVERDLVTAAVGEELQRRALLATGAAILAVAVFIGVRYRASFACGATIAVLHDLAVTLACITLAGYPLTLNVVAALLITIGYSVNDTIVIFDRVRENLGRQRRLPLAEVIDDSIGQTLRRTAITSGTTCLAVLSLYVLGGEVLRGFAFTMLSGVVAGTYSSIFIAPAVAEAVTRRRNGGGRLAPAAAPP